MISEIPCHLKDSLLRKKKAHNKITLLPKTYFHIEYGQLTLLIKQ